MKTDGNCVKVEVLVTGSGVGCYSVVDVFVIVGSVTVGEGSFGWIVSVSLRITISPL